MSIIKLPEGMIDVINGIVKSKYPFRVRAFEMDSEEWSIRLVLIKDLAGYLEALCDISPAAFVRLIRDWEYLYGDPLVVTVESCNSYRTSELTREEDFWLELLVSIPVTEGYLVRGFGDLLEKAMTDFKESLLRTLREVQLEKGV